MAEAFNRGVRPRRVSMQDHSFCTMSKLHGVVHSADYNTNISSQPHETFSLPYSTIYKTLTIPYSTIYKPHPTNTNIELKS